MGDEFTQQIKNYGLDAMDLPQLFGEEEISCFQFAKSPKISCYLYVCVSGPYATIESDKEEIRNYRFPLKLYCRKSLAKYTEMAKDNYFNVSKSGIDFYEKLFSTPFPFEKLDQVFIPDYNFGAMENVGCVVYNDNYI